MLNDVPKLQDSHRKYMLIAFPPSLQLKACSKPPFESSPYAYIFGRDEQTV